MAGYQKGKGIEDFGNFTEGFCFKLNLEFPQTQVYVICASDSVKINLKFYLINQ
jgi:hypothetical protein